MVYVLCVVGAGVVVATIKIKIVYEQSISKCHTSSNDKLHIASIISA